MKQETHSQAEHHPLELAQEYAPSFIQVIGQEGPSESHRQSYWGRGGVPKEEIIVSGEVSPATTGTGRERWWGRKRLGKAWA
jgi:hypothetical protein